MRAAVFEPNAVDLTDSAPCVLPCPLTLHEGEVWKALKKLDSSLNGNDVKGILFRMEKLTVNSIGF